MPALWGGGGSQIDPPLGFCSAVGMIYQARRIQFGLPLLLDFLWRRTALPRFILTATHLI